MSNAEHSLSRSNENAVVMEIWCFLRLVLANECIIYVRIAVMQTAEYVVNELLKGLGIIIGTKLEGIHTLDESKKGVVKVDFVLYSGCTAI